MFACLPLGYYSIIDKSFMCLEHQVDIVFQVDKAADVYDITAVNVELYIFFLQEVCSLHLPFGGHGIIA